MEQKINVYFSGVQATSIEYDQRILDVRPEQFRLFSCHGSYINFARKCMEDMITAGVSNRYEILLDSGAFTAWSKGEEITLEEISGTYNEIINEYGDKFKAFWMINLDKIPGERGRTATPSEIVEAMDVSVANCEALTKRFGSRVMPVYHQNEPQSYLVDLAENFDYLCISPRNDLAEKYRVSWSEEVHDIVNNKTHGLATTGYRQLSRVSWYSVDSAAWLMVASYGNLLLIRDNKFVIFSVSSQSGAIKDRNKHFDNMSKSIQELVTEECKAIGFNIMDLRDDVVERCIFNRIQTARFAMMNHNTKPLIKGLFDL